MTAVLTPTSSERLASEAEMLQFTSHDNEPSRRTTRLRVAELATTYDTRPLPRGARYLEATAALAQAFSMYLSEADEARVQGSVVGVFIAASGARRCAERRDAGESIGEYWGESVADVLKGKDCQLVLAAAEIKNDQQLRIDLGARWADTVAPIALEMGAGTEQPVIHEVRYTVQDSQLSWAVISHLGKLLRS